MSGQNRKAECPHCGKTFSAQHLRRHIEENHAVKRVVLVCPRCDHEETPAREDCMSRHINRNHGPLDDRPRRVSVPPYRGFRYCTVPGCRYRTAAEVHMRAHLRSRHPAWDPRRSTSSDQSPPPAAERSNSQPPQGPVPSSQPPQGTSANGQPKVPALMSVTIPGPKRDDRCDARASSQPPPPRTVAVRESAAAREISFGASDVRYYHPDGSRRSVPLTNEASNGAVPKRPADRRGAATSRPNNHQNAGRNPNMTSRQPTRPTTPANQTKADRQSAQTSRQPTRQTTPANQPKADRQGAQASRPNGDQTAGRPNTGTGRSPTSPVDRRSPGDASSRSPMSTSSQSPRPAGLPAPLADPRPHTPPRAVVAEVFSMGGEKKWLGTLHLSNIPGAGHHRMLAMSLTGPPELSATYYPAIRAELYEQ